MPPLGQSIPDNPHDKVNLNVSVGANFLRNLFMGGNPTVARPHPPSSLRNRTGTEDGITRVVTRSNRTGMNEGWNNESCNEEEKVAWGVVRGTVIKGLGPCFYLSPFGMRLRGVRI